MEASLPSPPRTVIVVADTPINLSFIRSVLDAHVLPYEVQVIDRGDPALDLLKHLTQHESRQAPTVILLDRTRPQRDGNALVRGLKTRWPSLLLQRVMRRWTPRHPAARPSTPRRPRWPCDLAWGIGLGLLGGLVWSGSSLWLSGQPPRVSLSPPPRSDHAAAAPAPSPAAEARPPAQRPSPAERASITGAALGDTPSDVLLQRPQASVAPPAAPLRPPAAALSRAARAGRPPHARRHYAPLRPATSPHLVLAKDDAGTSTRPRDVERARVVGTHRPGEPSAVLPASQRPWWRVAPDPAPEIERPWDRRIMNDTGA
jgi:CheY-like chemotaxis protein